MFGPLDVAPGLLHEFPHQVLHIAAHITGLAEFRRVGFDERDADEFGDVADEVGFADAGRAGDDDVLLGVFDRRGLAARRALAQEAGVVVVVAHRDRQDLLGLVLLDDEPVEVLLDLVRGEAEIERIGPLGGGSGLLDRRRCLGGGRGRLLEGRLQERLQAALHFFGTRKFLVAHRAGTLRRAAPGANS